MKEYPKGSGHWVWELGEGREIHIYQERERYQLSAVIPGYYKDFGWHNGHFADAQQKANALAQELWSI